MSMMYCDFCGVLVDTDHDFEHFNEDGGCVSTANEKEWLWGEMKVQVVSFQTPGSSGVRRGAPVEGFKVRCAWCQASLIPEHPHIALVDKKGPIRWWCSWGHASNSNDAHNRGADADIRDAKIGIDPEHHASTHNLINPNGVYIY